MTYEQLFFYMSNLVMELEGAAGKLLVHLIGTAISEGTNEIHATSRSLARHLRCWRNNITAAVEQLKPYIDVSVSQKTGYTFRLPADWFSEGRGIFTDFSSVEKSGSRSENRSTTGPNGDPPMDRLSGHSGRTNGENRATGGSKSGPHGRTNGENRATGGLQTEPVSTQNQQLTSGSVADLINQNNLIDIHFFDSIRAIAAAKTVLPEHRAEAMELAAALRTYHHQFGPSNRELGPVPEVIIARCLAVAPLGSLLSELKQLRIQAVRAGSKYAWYVSVFCQRLQGIPSNVLAAGLEAIAKEARCRPQASLDFSTRITDHIRQKSRRIV